jgi:serine/threonine protein kinase
VAIKISSIADLNTNIEHYIVREYQNHLKLDHPNIAKLYEVVEVMANHSVCIALEYCPGIELSTYIHEHTRVPEPRARYIVRQIL